MAARAIIATIRRYLSELPGVGIPVVSGVLYGSFARGEERADSDIDLLVISPVFDGAKDDRLVDALWHMTWRVDARIEPIPVGAREFEEEDGSPLIGIARQEGLVIKPLAAASEKSRGAYPVRASQPHTAVLKESRAGYRVRRKKGAERKR
jgi:predicted nucleotidyltransferase